MFDPAALDSDDRWHFYRRTALPALALVLVAGLQLFRVVSYDQTRWKGGGFGMFSTVDAETARFLKVSIDGRSIEVPSPLKKRAAVLCALPDITLAKDLAERVCQLRFEQKDVKWKRFPRTRIVSAADLPQPLADEQDAYQYWIRKEWLPVPASAPPGSGTKPTEATVEIWRHVYDSQTKQLRVERILSVSGSSAKEVPPPSEPSSDGGDDD